MEAHDASSTGPSVYLLEDGGHHKFSYTVLEIDEAVEEVEVKHTLKRTLGFYDGLGVMISIMIGSGIYASPGVALERSGSPGASLLAWCTSGILVCIASLCYVELGAMIPTAGGDFDYLTKAYGPAAGFSFAWYCFWICKPGAQAIIATVFGNYLMMAITGDTTIFDGNHILTYPKLLAVLLIFILTLVNCLGVKESSKIINFLTILKLLLVVMLLLFSLYFITYIDHNTMYTNFSNRVFMDDKILHYNNFFTSMIPCLFAFDGWADVNYLMEELIDSHIILHKLIVCGVVLVTICYVIANIAYLTVLPSLDIMTSNAVALNFGNAVLGKFGTLIFSVGVALSTMGSTNGSILTGGRVIYSIARAGQAPQILSRLNSLGAPYMALTAQAMWSITLILLPDSSFENLLYYFGPTSWLFYAFTGSTVILFRMRQPDADRPFKVPFYPFPPLVLIVMSVLLMANGIQASPFFSFLALGFVGLSFPVYFCMVWWENKK
jgi:L-type amino acid transporter 9